MIDLVEGIVKEINQKKFCLNKIEELKVVEFEEELILTLRSQENEIIEFTELKDQKSVSLAHILLDTLMNLAREEDAPPYFKEEFSIDEELAKEILAQVATNHLINQEVVR